MSWQKAESCIRGTMALISQCLREGENVALVLRDLGVLLIEGTRVEMKFYYDVLEMLCGKEDLQNAVLKVRGFVLLQAIRKHVGMAQARPKGRSCPLWDLGIPPTRDILPPLFSPLQVPQLMDTVVSRLAVIASLTSSGRVVIFPE